MFPLLRLVVLLALGAALLASDAVAQSQPATTRGGLTERYPLGDRTLESRPPASARLSAPVHLLQSTGRPAAVDAPPADDGSPVIVIVIAAVVLLAIAGAAAQEALEVGWFAKRRRPRH
ncbi:hypothetical protein [Conexibacter woesei]|uniref:Uncharacterized protein n=1 Tax=Conexibacter woesei (strain DSM 14684 / CCUG 47730 / CIP 108061 / JCM 11494 / NBRC 100937 / ID131577) TaxID=469383 RepID=D3EZI6_CONWI|nr:hypothetical protein [Conexibacter woesei]ADB53824.1 hypothetical protein Cwoe_5419 [Conexibacter woesei DSM 14684]